MSNLRGVLLDVDGTLINSNDQHAQAWVDILTESGFDDVPFEKIRRLIGMGGDKLLPEATGIEKDSPEGQELSKRRAERFKSHHLPTITAFEETRNLLLRMRADGLKLMVATSASEEELGPLLEIAGARDVLDGATSSSEAESSKPDPDIVQAALKKLGMSPDEVLMLGDTPYDIQAATKAGVGVVAFRCGGWEDGDLQGAVAVYDGPADLLASYDQSPFAAVKRDDS